MSAAIWQRVEDGAYTVDLPVWESIAAEYDRILEVGAGYGRVAQAARHAGADVTCLDLDASCTQAVQDLGLAGVQADARDFALGVTFALVSCPNRTIHLFGPAVHRLRFLRCARRHVRDGGKVAVSVCPRLEPWDPTTFERLPAADELTVDEHRYVSQPVGVLPRARYHVLDRQRSVEHGGRVISAERSRARVWRLSVQQLCNEANRAGLRYADAIAVASDPTAAGDEQIVMFDAC